MTLSIESSPEGSYTFEAGASAVVVISDLLNDDFAEAIPLVGVGANATGTNLGATRETGEPWHLGGTVNQGGRSVWWKWTAPQSGMVEIRTQGSTFDTVLAVYQGSRVDQLVLRGWNDDGGTNLTSRLSLSALAGETYFIAVDGYGLNSGDISLSISMGGAPQTLEVALYPSTATTLRERGPVNGAVWIGLNPAPSQATTITLRLSGNATPGVDYETSSPRSGDLAFVEIPAGSQWSLINFLTLADTDPAEFEKSIVVGIEPGPGYSASSTNSAVTLRVEDNTPYSADWAREFEGFQGSSTGLLDDPDGDGCPNLLEFLMDGDPLRADAGRFWIETRRLVDSRDGLEKPFAALILERRIDSAGVALVVESATRLDVHDWTPEGILLETIQLPHSARERVIHRSAEPIGNAARFFRLKASVP